MYDDEKILNFIDNSSYLFGDYISTQLKHDNIIELIKKILDESTKEISEAILILLTVIKYISKDKYSDVFSELEINNSFQKYISDNYELLFKLAKEKSVQGNMPDRALPLLDVFKNDTVELPLRMIELGASFGLIGHCLLNPSKVLENRKHYFADKQQIPESKKGIVQYLGIEFDPPDKDWLLASCWKEDYNLRLKNFIDDIQGDERFELIKGNAFGFSKLEAVKKIAEKPGTIIVLTSFMLYQYDDNKKEILIDEIQSFRESVNGHWINQAVNVSLDSKDNEYYIAWDGKKIIELIDDSCLSWRLIK